MGANVIITEVNPLRALEAVMDGYKVVVVKSTVPVGTCRRLKKLMHGHQVQPALYVGLIDDRLTPRAAQRSISLPVKRIRDYDATRHGVDVIVV
jgi:UDP-N-acetyl-D-mannosaminuronate dehydrogenase